MVLRYVPLLGVYLTDDCLLVVLDLHVVLQQLLLELHLLDVDAVGGRRPLLEDIYPQSLRATYFFRFRWVISFDLYKLRELSHNMLIMTKSRMREENREWIWI